MKKKLFGIFALSSVLVLASCGAKSKERETYITVCDKVLQTMQAKETKLRSLEVSEGEYDILEDEKELTIVKTMVYFVKLLYQNESYPLSDKAVYSKANYVKDGKILQFNEQAIKANFDKEKNSVEIELLGTSSLEENAKYSTPAYFCLSVDYDFEKNDVTSYGFYLADVYNLNNTSSVTKEELNLHIHEIYDGKNIYSLRYDSTKKSEITENYYDKFNALSLEYKSLELSGDFSNEYTKATNEMLGESYFD